MFAFWSKIYVRNRMLQFHSRTLQFLVKWMKYRIRFEVESRVVPVTVYQHVENTLVVSYMTTHFPLNRFLSLPLITIITSSNIHDYMILYIFVLCLHGFFSFHFFQLQLLRHLMSMITLFYIFPYSAFAVSFQQYKPHLLSRFLLVHLERLETLYEFKTVQECLLHRKLLDVKSSTHNAHALLVFLEKMKCTIAVKLTAKDFIVENCIYPYNAYYEGDESIGSRSCRRRSDRMNRQRS